VGTLGLHFPWEGYSPMDPPEAWPWRTERWMPPGFVLRQGLHQTSVPRPWGASTFDSSVPSTAHSSFRAAPLRR